MRDIFNRPTKCVVFFRSWVYSLLDHLFVYALCVCPVPYEHVTNKKRVEQKKKSTNSRSGKTLHKNKYFFLSWNLWRNRPADTTDDEIQENLNICCGRFCLFSCDSRFISAQLTDDIRYKKKQKKICVIKSPPITNKLNVVFFLSVTIISHVCAKTNAMYECNHNKMAPYNSLVPRDTLYDALTFIALQKFFKH